MGKLAASDPDPKDEDNTGLNTTTTQVRDNDISKLFYLCMRKR